MPAAAGPLWGSGLLLPLARPAAAAAMCMHMCGWSTHKAGCRAPKTLATDERCCLLPPLRRAPGAHWAARLPRDQAV